MKIFLNIYIYELNIVPEKKSLYLQILNLCFCIKACIHLLYKLIIVCKVNSIFDTDINIDIISL